MGGTANSKAANTAVPIESRRQLLLLQLGLMARDRPERALRIRAAANGERTLIGAPVGWEGRATVRQATRQAAAYRMSRR